MALEPYGIPVFQGTIVPADNEGIDIGAIGRQWRTAYVRNIISTNFTVTSLTAVTYVSTRATIPYSTSMTPNLANGNWQTITIADGVAFTINAPTNPVLGATLTFTLKNTSGGAAGAATWNAVFKLAAWTNPATATNRSITYGYDGTNWIELSRTTVDVPN
jgi:hypothetical protein